MVVGCDHHGAVQGHCQAADCCAHFWDQLAAAGIGCEVPHPDVPCLIACGV
jgi:hypothetical protein